jgi:uncharacterized membrane protein (UPF0127 family)
MLTNARRREILNNVRNSGYPGSISEVFQAAVSGRDLVQEFQIQQQQEQEMQVAQTQQEQEVGLREQHTMGNTQASMAFPDVQPNQSFNTVGMKAPIDIQKVDDQGHLVESYKNVPPGIQDLPTGPAEGTIIESPAAYQKGGLRKRGYVQKYQTAGFDMSAFNMNPITTRSDATQVINNNVIVEARENELDAAFAATLKENYQTALKKGEKPMPTPVQREILFSDDYTGSRKKVASEKITTSKRIKRGEGSGDKLIDDTKRNMNIILSNSLMTSQMHGGKGSQIALQNLTQAQEEGRLKDHYKNLLHTSGNTMMKWNALGVATLAGGGGGLGGASPYVNQMIRGTDIMRKSAALRPIVKGGLQTAYNAAKLYALPKIYNLAGNLGWDLSTGDYEGNIRDRLMETGRGVVEVDPRLQTIKEGYKMSHDAWKGDYASVLTRALALRSKSAGIGKGLEYYGAKLGNRFIPESWQNLGGLPSLESVYDKNVNPFISKIQNTNLLSGLKPSLATTKTPNILGNRFNDNIYLGPKL